MKKPLSLSLVVLLLIPLSAQQPASIPIHVEETAGIRRTMYPVAARVEIPEGGVPGSPTRNSIGDEPLPANSQVRLRLNGADVPAQFGVGSTWPDGSVRALDVDFNTSIGPREALNYLLEYGAGVTQPPAPRGLAATEASSGAATPGDPIRVGNVLFDKHASPLFLSVKYRDEDIGAGPSGFAVVDGNGRLHELSIANPAPAVSPGSGPLVGVAKPGPLNVVLRYRGRLALAESRGQEPPFTIDVEMPNSKSWVKAIARVQDPDQQVRALVFRVPLSLGAFPLLWDFGTTNGTYGVFRAVTDSAVLAQSPAPGGRWNWHVDTGAANRAPQPVESESGSPVEARWGHLQGAKDAVAFAAEHPEDGSSVFSLDGTGQLVMQFTPARPSTSHTFVVYLHFVTTPIQIGAATTPAAMIAPLNVR